MIFITFKKRRSRNALTPSLSSYSPYLFFISVKSFIKFPIVFSYFGFAIASKEIIADMNSIKFSFNPFNLNSVTMAAGIAAVKDTYYRDQCINRIVTNREQFKSDLAKLGFHVIPSKANFVFCYHDAISSSELCEKLKEEGILTRHFADKKLDKYLRITIGTEQEMAVVLIAIKEILAEVKV